MQLVDQLSSALLVCPTVAVVPDVFITSTVLVASVLAVD